MVNKLPLRGVPIFSSVFSIWFSMCFSYGFPMVFPATSFHGWHCPTKQGRICVTYVMTHAARIGQFEEVSSDPRQRSCLVTCRDGNRLFGDII